MSYLQQFEVLPRSKRKCAEHVATYAMEVLPEDPEEDEEDYDDIF